MPQASGAALLLTHLAAAACLAGALAQPNGFGGLAGNKDTTTPAPATFEVRILPGPASWPEAQTAQAASLANDWSSLGAQVSKAKARASSALEAADRASVAATQGKLQASAAVAKAVQGASRVIALRRRALEAARVAKQLMAEMPAAIERGVNKAVDEVVVAAMQRLDAEVKVAAAAAAPRSPPASSANQGVAETLEQVQAGASLAAAGLGNAARDMTAVAADIKRQAADLAHQVAQLQGEGQSNKADEVQMKSRELMAQLQPLSDEAAGMGLAASAADLEAQAYRALAETPAVAQSVAPDFPAPPAALRLP